MGKIINLVSGDYNLLEYSFVLIFQLFTLPFGLFYSSIILWVLNIYIYLWINFILKILFKIDKIQWSNWLISYAYSYFNISVPNYYIKIHIKISIRNKEK